MQKDFPLQNDGACSEVIFYLVFISFPYLFFQLVLEGVRARQLQEIMLIEKQTLEKEIQQANASLVLFEMKAARVEDQVI